MEILKSGRFWLMLIGMVGAFALAYLDKITGTEAIAFVGGVLTGVGISQPGAKRTGSTLLALIFAGALLLPAGGCATTPEGKTTIDQCKAYRSLVGAHEIASGAAQIVCGNLPGEKRAKCFEYYKRSKAAGDLVVNVAAGVLKACGL